MSSICSRFAINTYFQRRGAEGVKEGKAHGVRGDWQVVYRSERKRLSWCAPGEKGTRRARTNRDIIRLLLETGGRGQRGVGMINARRAEYIKMYYVVVTMHLCCGARAECARSGARRFCSRATKKEGRWLLAGPPCGIDGGSAMLTSSSTRRFSSHLSREGDARGK